MQQNRKHRISPLVRFPAGLMSLALLFSSVSFPYPALAAEKTVEQLEARYNQIEKQLKENEKKMAENVEDQSKQKAKIASLETEIDSLND